MAEVEESINKIRNGVLESRPDCVVCYDKIWYKDLADLDCAFEHPVHKECLKMHIKAQVEERNYPIMCPAGPACGPLRLTEPR